MANHRILLFGGNGQIGTTLKHHTLPADWDLGVTTRETCDFLNPASIGKAIHDFAPDLVINAAAMTDIDACQKNPTQAQEVNFHAVAHIAGQCANADAPFIQISTDYVFDGTEGEHIYQPDDPMNPVNVYGQTKMLGEEAARHGLYWHVILRTSLIFSAFGNNVLTKTLHQMNTLDEIQAVTDQKANPTSADAVADALITITSAILAGKGNGFGTFHISSDPAVTRFEFLEAIMEAYAPYTDRRPKLVAVKSSDLVGRVPRPPITMLGMDKTRDVYAIHPRNWRDDLAKSIKEYVDKRSEGFSQ
jgi:dTDP-4-dehydrorhamnose reductase